MEEIQVVFLESSRAVCDVIDDPMFSHVVDNGEIYEAFEVTAITREYINHPHHWTHSATVKHLLTQKLFTADLRIRNFCIDESEVYEFPTPTA